MSQGFTLIELLETVIIIGILATVALPYYNVAVEKSRCAEAISNGTAIVEAMDRAYTERPWMLPNTKSTLDVFPTGVNWTSSSTFTTRDFSYDISNGSYISITRSVKGGSYTINMYNEFSDTPGKKTCSSSGELAENICRSLASAGVELI